MPTVTVTYPTGDDRRELACHLDSAAHWTVYAADLDLPGGREANPQLSGGVAVRLSARLGGIR